MNLVVLLSLFVSCLCQEYFKSVLVANDSTFNSVIYNKESKYTLMNFYSTSCVHCNALGPQYSIVADLFKDNKHIQIAQIEAKINRKTRMKEKIVGFPCIRLYGPDGTHIASFVGERLADDMATWITQNIGAKPIYPSKTVELVNDSSKVLELMNDPSRKLMVFFAPWLDDWKQKITQFERSSWGYKDEMKFYEIDVTSEENSEAMSFLKITKYPTLVYFNGGKIRTATERDLNEKKIRWFIDDDATGDSYYSLDDLIEDQIDDVYDDDEIPKGYGFHQKHAKFDNVDEEEMYRKLREL